MLRRIFLIPSLAGALAASALAQAPAAPAPRARVTAAIERGLRFLDQQQKPEGYWTSAEFPGLTALVVQAYLAAPGGQSADSAAARKGLNFIRANARPDGGIYGQRMANYNTSICLATLLRRGEARDAGLIDAAQKFLVGAQTKNSANPANDGGFGYDPASGPKPSRPDLDNTVFALEALKLYRDANRARELPAAQDLNWQAALDFITRCQQPASAPEGERGGLGYTPAGTGKEPLRAYGTMTYAGVLSFLYADLKKDDPRLLTARDWLFRHYTLEENPGQGPEGLYYYYHLMAKALRAHQVSEFKTGDGRNVNWAAELADKLLALQKPDGSWVSENGRWMEKDPNLVTTYGVLALCHIAAQP